MNWYLLLGLGGRFAARPLHHLVLAAAFASAATRAASLTHSRWPWLRFGLLLLLGLGLSYVGGPLLLRLLHIVVSGGWWGRRHYFRHSGDRLHAAGERRYGRNGEKVAADRGGRAGAGGGVVVQLVEHRVRHQIVKLFVRIQKQMMVVIVVDVLLVELQLMQMRMPVATSTTTF